MKFQPMLRRLTREGNDDLDERARMAGKEVGENEATLQSVQHRASERAEVRNHTREGDQKYS